MSVNHQTGSDFTGYSYRVGRQLYRLRIVEVLKTNINKTNSHFPNYPYRKPTQQARK